MRRTFYQVLCGLRDHPCIDWFVCLLTTHSLLAHTAVRSYGQQTDVGWVSLDLHTFDRHWRAAEHRHLSITHITVRHRRTSIFSLRTVTITSKHTLVFCGGPVVTSPLNMARTIQHSRRYNSPLPTARALVSPALDSDDSSSSFSSPPPRSKCDRLAYLSADIQSNRSKSRRKREDSSEGEQAESELSQHRRKRSKRARSSKTLQARPTLSSLRLPHQVLPKPLHILASSSRRRCCSSFRPRSSSLGQRRTAPSNRAKTSTWKSKGTMGGERARTELGRRRRWAR